MARNWVQAVLKFHLRSFQLGFRIMSISHKYPRQVSKLLYWNLIINVKLFRHHPKRQLALRLASHCGNQQATKEFRALQNDKILDAQVELKLLPDMTVCEWGKGKDLGKLVSRPGTIQQDFLEDFSNFLFSSQRTPPSRSTRDCRSCWNPDG